MVDNKYPSLTEFLTWPHEEIAKTAPASMVYGLGGTRRGAAFSGISSDSDEYASWSRERMVESCHLLFRHGVNHVFIPGVLPSNFQEVGPYRQSLVDWVDWGLAGPEALADYDRLGWRVRLLGYDSLPELAEIAERLVESTTEQRGHTLWFHVIPDFEYPWQSILTAVHRTGAKTRTDAINALYGEDIPLISLFISFGKPQVSPVLIPPLLAGDVQAYWYQRISSFYLNEREFRTILHDYAYLRPTWQADKRGRAEQALEHREIWEKAPILGVGSKLGPFWYPTPVTDWYSKPGF